MISQIHPYITKWYPFQISYVYPDDIQLNIQKWYPSISMDIQMISMDIQMISMDIHQIFIFPVWPSCHSRWDRSNYVHQSWLWQQACPSLASWDDFRPCGAPAPTGVVAVSSLPGQRAAAAGMLSWARGFAILYTTRVAACMPSLSLRRLFLAAMCHSQNQ